jgi:mannose/cellobiose epimerase-like protein (N-acyl-D-glucosamine 2-epimerase family)
MAKRLAKETSSDDNYKNIVAEFLDQLIRHFVIELKGKRFDKAYIQGMSLLFAHDSRLHKLNFQIPDEEIKKLATVH